MKAAAIRIDDQGNAQIQLADGVQPAEGIQLFAFAIGHLTQQLAQPPSESKAVRPSNSAELQQILTCRNGLNGRHA